MISLRRRVALLAVIAGLTLTACGTKAGADTPTLQPKGAGTDVSVDRVVDGDTIIVKSGKQTARVRFIGMDTPETVDPKRPVGCFGKQASDYTKSLLPKGTAVRLTYDVEKKDKYGRTLAYVYRRHDGLFVNSELVKQGYATTLTIPPNVAHVDDFTALATEAREQDRGLWAACH